MRKIRFEQRFAGSNSKEIQKDRYNRNLSWALGRSKKLGLPLVLCVERIWFLGQA